MPGDDEYAISKTENKQKIASLRLQRGTVTAQQTKLKNYIETPNRSMSMAEAETRLGLLESYMVRFNEIQGELEVEDPEESKGEKRQIYEDSYVIIKIKLLALIEQRRPQSSVADISTIISSRRSANLPKIELKKFSGKFQDWQDFHATFKVLVEMNNELTDIEKLAYLRGSLEDGPLQVIGNIRLSDNGFEDAMKLLKACYDNSKLIFQGHLQQLFRLRSAEKPSVLQLRTLNDEAKSHVRALESMATTKQIADGLLVKLLCDKLDPVTRARWEESSELDKLPSASAFFEFLDKRSQALENIEQATSMPNSFSRGTHSRQPSHHPAPKASSFTASRVDAPCKACKSTEHDISKCKAFLILNPLDRYNEAKRLNLCINCLKLGHAVKHCKSSRCRYCNSRHNTLLHRHADKSTNPFSPTTSDSSPDIETTSSLSVIGSPTSIESETNDILLATAVVKVKDKNGNFQLCRALLDSGSSLHFISEHLVQRLRSKKSKAYIDVSGIGTTKAIVKHKTRLSISSTLSDFQTCIEAYILPRITGEQPSRLIKSKTWGIPNNITLADPKFYAPGQVDILIGASLFYELLCVGQIRLGLELPTLQKTLLGWIVAGGRSKKSSFCFAASKGAEPTDENLDSLVRKFWELEEVALASDTTQNECLNHYRQNTRRDETGRFWVRLPFEKDPALLGNSLDTARRRFFNLEHKLMKNPDLRQPYSDFIHEYEKLGHLEKIAPSMLPKKHYILPHHCIFKPESSSTKLRVVFDASCKTTTSYSLNDVLRPGPVVQDDLFTILVRFRSYKYALTADITKMYRQVRIHESDTSWQCILWRDSPQDPLDIYRLLTVTYGTSPGSFLATESLNQLAREEETRYPIGATVVKRDFYVDDMLTGASSLSDAKIIQSQVTKLLQLGKFELTKWCSNASELIESLDGSNKEKYLKISGDNVIKTLGMIWQPQMDTFRFEHLPPENSSRITKRKILSSIGRIFDPLGLINPIIVKAKVILQRLWTLDLAWDESIPQDLHSEWANFCHDMELISQLRIPRYIFAKSGRIELHGFADASMTAYGACVYIRCIQGKEIKCNLLAAKSRVAPLKTITIPRLELCAALLASHLTAKIHNIFSQHIDAVYCWSDSTIVLSWIASSPSKWSVFVSNRIAQIQHLTNKFMWRHVPTTDNPADLISRGATLSVIISSYAWFNGPNFLQLSDDLWPKLPKIMEAPPELKKSAALVAYSTQSWIESSKLINSYQKFINTMAYVLRFATNAKVKRGDSSERELGPLTVKEIDGSLRIIIRCLQRDHFREELLRLISQRALPANSIVKALDPFIDNEGLMRVGGRLRNSLLTFAERHPIFLPKCVFTKTLLTHYHFRNLNAGAQTLLAIVRTKYWPINGKRMVKQVIKDCVHCFRTRPKVIQQIMGQLPADRVRPAPAFAHCGVDLCGPFYVKHPVRNRPAIKTYICLFICLVVKAVHLEVATDLSTDAFLSVLRKFVARRPGVSVIYSDNATNFVGGARQLKELKELFVSSQSKEHIREVCRHDGIEWKFIPPRSPHFGGLWESAIKQAKQHLRRTLGLESYSFDELQRLACQVEAVLNSRPLTPISDDPKDLQILTPGHFIAGGPMTCIPEPNFANANTKLLSRWQYMQAKLPTFWKNWQRDYLQNLQIRNKWQTTAPNVKEDDLVLIKEDHLPPLKWPLGRIVELLPGKDGHVRVVNVRTTAGIIKRPVVRLALLPLNRSR